MAAPLIYTEATFKVYLHAALGAAATALGWTVDGGDYDEIVNETLLAYGVADIADAADIRKVRALGRREAWRGVITAVSLDYDFKADGGSYSRSQMQEQARQAFALAESEALPYDDAYTVEVGRLELDYDPYQPDPWEEAT